MHARFLIATVILIASFACAGGPTSDFPANTPTVTLDAGLDEPGRTDDDAQDAGSGASSEMDAASPIGTEGPPCIGDAGDASSDAAGDAETADGDATAHDAGDAAASDAGDAAQIEAGENFPEASTDAEADPADAASDAPYSSADGAVCSP